jgi:hypothetical protein
MGSAPFINRQGGTSRGRNVCQAVWMCTNWTMCDLNYTQFRSCSDVNNCGSGSGRPVSVRDCMYEPQCENAQRDGDETGVDCGGDYCNPCVGQASAAGSGAAGGGAAGAKKTTDIPVTIKTTGPDETISPIDAIPPWAYVGIAVAVIGLIGAVLLRKRQQEQPPI